mgnify:CR=1 FL=1
MDKNRQYLYLYSRTGEKYPRRMGLWQMIFLIHWPLCWSTIPESFKASFQFIRRFHTTRISLGIALVQKASTLGGGVYSEVGVVEGEGYWRLSSFVC